MSTALHGLCRSLSLLSLCFSISVLCLLYSLTSRQVDSNMTKCIQIQFQKWFLNSNCILCVLRMLLCVIGIRPAIPRSRQMDVPQHSDVILCTSTSTTHSPPAATHDVDSLASDRNRLTVKSRFVFLFRSASGRKKERRRCPHSQFGNICRLSRCAVVCSFEPIIIFGMGFVLRPTLVFMRGHNSVFGVGNRFDWFLDSLFFAVQSVSLTFCFPSAV